MYQNLVRNHVQCQLLCQFRCQLVPLEDVGELPRLRQLVAREDVGQLLYQFQCPCHFHFLRHLAPPVDAGDLLRQELPLLLLA